MNEKLRFVSKEDLRGFAPHPTRGLNPLDPTLAE